MIEVEENTDYRKDLFEHYQFHADKGQEPLRVDKFLMNQIENATISKNPKIIQHNHNYG